MKIERPHFELARVYADGTSETPQIIPVGQIPWDTSMERRGFLGVGVGVASLLLLLEGKATAQRTDGQQASPASANRNSDAPAKVPAKVLNAHTSRISSLRINPDGKILTSHSENDDRTTKLWTLADGKLTATFDGRVVISPDWKTIAVPLLDGIELWSLPEAKQLTTIRERGQMLNGFAISPDSKRLAASWKDLYKTPKRGVGDNDIKLWSLPDGRLISTIKGNSDEVVTTLVFSPDGKALASLELRYLYTRTGRELGAANDTIKLWSLPDGVLRNTLRTRFLGFDHQLMITPDSKILITGSSTVLAGEIKLWSLPDGRPLFTFPGFTVSTVTALSFDGRILAANVGDEKAVSLWTLPDGKPLKKLRGHTEAIRQIIIAPGGETLISISSDKTIKLWSLPDGSLLSTLKGHQDTIWASAVSSDWKTLATGSGDSTVKLWSLTDGNLLGTLEGHQKSISELAISSDGKVLASGDDGGVIILWDLEKRSFLSFLFDPKASETDAIAYNQYDRTTGFTLTFTLPCGSPIPPGAVCTCNCVPGTYRRPSPSGGGYPSGGGTYCTCNKICTCIPVPSDRDVKEAFETTDPLTILQRLAELPIQTWNYNWDDASVRHIGPMAQDFAAAFAVGEDDKHIHPVDAQGVAFAAIQALYQIVKEKDAQTERLRTELLSQQEENKALNDRVEALERLVTKAP
jgi:WD40 repeat protein